MEFPAIDQFLVALEKSELLTAEQLAEARQIAAGESDSYAAAKAMARKGLLTRWQAAQVLAGRSAAAFRLGKYKLLELLGRGGMGSVFAAHHVTMNRRVALKILSKGLDRNPAAMERFLAEARAIAALDHPNIVQAYSVDNEDDRFYLVMEFVDGRDLAQIVEDSGPLSYDAAADAIRQAAEGLAHAHAKGMIHCDIKPSNLLVNNQGVVKILDLGVARLTGPKPAEADAKDEKVAGTIDYMAPEQARGGAFDQRADVYALGCTLYFLLTGHAPFPTGSIHERILKHQTEQPASILERRPDAPKDLVRIARKMMAKDPVERFQTAAEVAEALSHFNPAQRELKRAVPLDDASVIDPLADLGLDWRPGVGLSGAHRISGLKSKKAIDQNLMLLIAGGVFGVALLVVVAVILMVATSKRPASRGTPPAVTSPQTDEDDEAQRRAKAWGLDLPKFDAPVQGGFGSAVPAKKTDPPKKPGTARADKDAQKKDNAAAKPKTSPAPAKKP